jgi:CBS domain containing-hemolysin-like protein
MIIVAIIIMLIISAFFSGTEIAFLSADRLKIAVREQQGSKRAKILGTFFNEPSRFLGTLLVGNNIALVIFGNLMEETLAPQLQEFLPKILTGELGMLFSITLVSTITVLIFGEFIPKALFRLFATNAMILFARLHKAIQTILSPLVFLMVRTSEWLLEKIFNLKMEADEQVFTRVDMVNYMRAHSNETLDTEMFQKAIELKEIDVEDCMIPRENIKSISINASIEELTIAFMNAHVSRLIVYNGNLDNIVGYVHHLQLLTYPTSIRDMVRPNLPKFSMDMPALESMNKFIKDRVTIGYVYENGKTLGLIALEDILEQVFGDIDDEYDKPI